MRNNDARGRYIKISCFFVGIPAHALSRQNGRMYLYFLYFLGAAFAEAQVAMTTTHTLSFELLHFRPLLNIILLILFFHLQHRD